MNPTVRTATSCYNNFSGGSIRTRHGHLGDLQSDYIGTLEVTSSSKTNKNKLTLLCRYLQLPCHSFGHFPGALSTRCDNAHYPAQSSEAAGLDCCIYFIATILNAPPPVATIHCGHEAKVRLPCITQSIAAESNRNRTDELIGPSRPQLHG